VVDGEVEAGGVVSADHVHCPVADGAGDDDHGHPGGEAQRRRSAWWSG
jgi:hypothetical protein